MKWNIVGQLSKTICAVLFIFVIVANAVNYHTLDNDGDNEPTPSPSELIRMCPSHPG